MAMWKIDSSHSEIRFKVKHLVVSTVTGNFGKFDASIQTSKDDFSDAKIMFEADVNSINTKSDQRDTHLKSPDFFDAAKYPSLKFISTSVRKISDFEMEVVGDLTLRGVTRQIKLNVLYNGTVSGFAGQRVAGFEISGKLNRFDYGLQWNALTEAGGVVVSNEVRLELHTEFTLVEAAIKAA